MKNQKILFVICVPVFLAGTFFCFADEAAEGQLLFARQLFGEAQWKDAQVECMRVLAEDPGNEDARFMRSVCSLRLTNKTKKAVEDLQVLFNMSSNRSLRVDSACELGIAAWEKEKWRNAADYLVFAYDHAQDQADFVKAGYALVELMEQNPSLKETRPDVVLSLDAVQSAWDNDALTNALPRPKGRASVFSLPGRAVVGFYRFAVSPALGQRCSLEPSCSEYFKQASLKHGILGVAIQADRFYREPSVVSAAEKEVLVNGQIKIADPLSDHDFWMEQDE